jgi:RNA polymerase subunit RPABC4/transcription elongation factor Spt4
MVGAAKRLCRKCRSRLGIDDDVCQACGTNNPVPLPWYTMPLGALIVVALVLLLVDFDDIAQVFGFE